jgi:hypothetical protein
LLDLILFIHGFGVEGRLMARRAIGQEGFSFATGEKTSELDALSVLINWPEADTLMAPIS